MGLSIQIVGLNTRVIGLSILIVGLNTRIVGLKIQILRPGHNDHRTQDITRCFASEIFTAVLCHIGTAP
jgi:hypothetical protein